MPAASASAHPASSTPARVQPGSTNRSRFSLASPPPCDTEIRGALSSALKGGRQVPWRQARGAVETALKRQSVIGDSPAVASELLRYYASPEVAFIRELDGRKIELTVVPARRPERPDAPIGGDQRPMPPASTVTLAAAGVDADVTPAGDDLDTDGDGEGSDGSTDSGDDEVARGPGHITFRYLPLNSGDHTLYLFKVGARDLAERGLIPRLADDKLQGFQRQQRDTQVRDIVEAMRKGIPFPEGLILNLMGEWIYDSTELVGDETECYHVIDGGHRQIACAQLLAAGEHDVLERYEFPAVAVLRAPIEVCRMLFRLQDERLHIDSGHMLALRAASGAHTNDNERAAYELATALNTRDDSPLKGRIRFGDRGGRAAGGELVHVRSILVMLKTIVGRRSPFAALDPAVREQVAVDYFRAFAAVHTHFLDPEHVLGQPLGLCALLVILGDRDHRFHGEVRERRPAGAAVAYTVGTMETVFQISGRYFHWSPRKDADKRRSLNHHTLATRFHEFLASKAKA